MGRVYLHGYSGKLAVRFMGPNPGGTFSGSRGKFTQARLLKTDGMDSVVQMDMLVESGLAEPLKLVIINILSSPAMNLYCSRNYVGL